MNALTVLSVIALAACSSGQILGYPGIYGFPGLISGAAPITLKTVAATSPVAVNTISPVAYNALPFAPVAPIQTQYHSQDELGQYAFGYAGGPASRAESRDAFGIVRGSYNYVDSEGKVQTQHYVADALGFRVSGTNLPVAPAAPEPAALAAPAPVADTPEVAAAKAAHEAAHSEAAAASAVAPARKKRAILTVPGVGAISPLRFSYGFSSPLAYSHPAVVGAPLQYTAAVGAVPAFAPYTAAAAPAITAYTTGYPAVTAYNAAATAAPRDAALLRVVNNPNHAVSYRVD
ncbi:cuticle protein 19.8-like [Macrobrachium rosenbergii]|uniref:cuticle protein 19.8-like n=1 Tax=Macrobrachium rosenbergii TaxID=79674 RepID=UPI0034D3CFBF